MIWRSLGTPAIMSLCPSSNDPLSTGVYSVEVYDIERDGSVSSVPALAEELPESRTRKKLSPMRSDMTSIRVMRRLLSNERMTFNIALLRKYKGNSHLQNEKGTHDKVPKKDKIPRNRQSHALLTSPREAEPPSS
ncbi:hypothetical protein EMCRGX_G017602 [Ephydatia muelleri]